MAEPRELPYDPDRPEDVLRHHARRLDGRRWRWPLLGSAYHTLADAIYWDDEIPFWWRLPELENALRFLWHYRTGLLVGEARPWGEFWELGLRLFPRWVGFHPSRHQPERRHVVLLRAGRIACLRWLNELDRESDGQ
jgi:hypothetical protein